MDLFDQLKIYSILQSAPVSELFHQYLHMVAEYLKRYPRFIPCLIDEPGILLGGAACYYGTHALALAQNLSPPTDGRICRLTFLYMIVDSLLDRPDVPTETRDHFKSIIGNLLKSDNLSPDSFIAQLRLGETNDPFLLMVLKEVYILFKECPEARQSLKNLFKAELLSSEIQSKSYHSRDMYLEIAKEKGGLTVIALQALIGGPLTPDIHRLGAIIQYLDDLLDVDEDVADGNMTIATYDLVINGNLNSLIDLVESEIEKLPDSLKFFRQAFRIGMVYVKSRKFHYLREIDGTQLLDWPKMTELIGQQLCSGLKKLLDF